MRNEKSNFMQGKTMQSYLTNKAINQSLSKRLSVNNFNQS